MLSSAAASKFQADCKLTMQLLRAFSFAWNSSVKRVNLGWPDGVAQYTLWKEGRRHVRQERSTGGAPSVFISSTSLGGRDKLENHWVSQSSPVQRRPCEHCSILSLECCPEVATQPLSKISTVGMFSNDMSMSTNCDGIGSISKR